MSAPVNVLAAMDSCISYMSKTAGTSDLREARAAVAELIESATELAGDQVFEDLDEPDYESAASNAARSRNNGQRIYWRVLSALANIGPQS